MLKANTIRHLALPSPNSWQSVGWESLLPQDSSQSKFLLSVSPVPIQTSATTILDLVHPWPSLRLPPSILRHHNPCICMQPRGSLRKISPIISLPRFQPSKDQPIPLKLKPQLLALTGLGPSTVASQPPCWSSCTPALSCCKTWTLCFVGRVSMQSPFSDRAAHHLLEGRPCSPCPVIPPLAPHPLLTVFVAVTLSAIPLLTVFSLTLSAPSRIGWFCVFHGKSYDHPQRI